MNEKKLREAQLLSSDIWQIEGDINDIGKIIEDYDNFGSTIEFKRNKDSYSRSFGSKKNKFKEDLKNLLIDLKKTKQQELIVLKEEFAKL